MADHHLRIHPLQDVQASLYAPSAPPFPRDMSKSDRGEPAEEQAVPVVEHPNPKPLPKKKRSRSSCCCKLLCWTVSLLLILIVEIGITIGILYLVFTPKLPNYSIDEVRMTKLSLSTDNNLSATFEVTVTARNPNERIGVYYEGGSCHVSAWYMDTKLCEGSLPKFYQGHRNTTVLHLSLSGHIQNATGLQSVLQEQLQQTGNIPLNLKAEQPVRVKLGKLKLFKVKLRVRCTLVVDSLERNNKVRIVSRSCKFRLRL